MDAVHKHERDIAQLLVELRKISRFQQQTEGFVFCNKGAATVPPFGIVQITGNEMGQLKGERPADSYGRSGWYVVNGPQSVAVNAYGVGFRGITPVACDATTYVRGDRLRAVASSYEASKHPCGNLLVIGLYELRSQTDIFLCVEVGFPSTVDFVAPGGGIAAATGTTTLTMGSASCDIWDDAGTAGQISDSGSDETIYNIFDKAVPAGARGKASLNGNGLWVCQEIPITDLRLNGDDYQYWRGGQWTTWISGSDCPEVP
jgi:hypothetical protein